MRTGSILLTITLLSVLGLGSARADEASWLDTLQVHGFASQAAVQTSDNHFFGDSDDQFSLDFTELGINASLQPQPWLLLSGQLLSRRAGEMYDGSPTVDYALADITFAATPDYLLDLRIGRIKNPLGLYNETRDVPFTHPGIFLPQVVYYDRVRNLMLASDGMMLHGELYGDTGTFTFTLGGGQSVMDENVEWVFLQNDFNGEFKPDSNSFIASLWYTLSGNQLKFGLSGATLPLKFNAGPFSPLDGGITRSLYWIASIQYDAEDWTLSAEYASEPLEWRDYGPFFMNRKVTTEGYYLQGLYRIRPDIQLMLRYEEGFADRNNRAGTPPPGVTASLLPPYANFSKIWTTGLRWDIDRNWMLRVEYQRHHGTFVLSPRENLDPGQLREDWDLFAIQAAFRF